jgi:UDP-glucose 4-epimerase
MAKALAKASHTVIVFDNLATGHRDAVRYGAFVEGDLHNIVRTVLDWMHTRS